MRKILTICLTLMGLGFGGAVVAQTIGSVSGDYIEEGNLVRGGNLIRTITMSVGDHAGNAKSCRQACDADGNCYAYTYRQVAQQFKPECQLRMIANSSNSRRNHGFLHAVSATKTSFVGDVWNMSLKPGQAIMGGTTLRQFDVSNADPIACLEACWRNNSCKGVTYFPKGFFRGKAPSCTMYSQASKITSGTPRAGVLTAMKNSSPLPVINRPIPRPTPTLTPNRPILEIPRGSQVTIPDEDANPSLSDDDDAQFPGEMLDPVNGQSGGPEDE
ncbi:MAG: PAN domain-containing protein [Pseudomonadota bacterium]